MSKICIVIAPEDYQDVEYQTPREILEKNGHEIIVAGSRTGTAHGKLGGTTEIEKEIKEINASDFDAIICVGGPGAVNYQHDQTLHELLKAFFDANKLCCAICIAPTILAYAGILNGKDATVWTDSQNTQAKILKDQGATYKPSAVVVDKNIITADGPKAAKKFGKTINKSLS